MIKSPVLIVGCARSGTTLLYNVLSEIPELWSTGSESKAIIEHYHHPAAKGWSSGELDTEDLTPESRRYILQAFERRTAPGSYWRWVNDRRRLLNRRRWYAAIKRGSRSDSPASGLRAVPVGGLAAAQRVARLRHALAPPRGAIRLLDKSPEHCLRLPFLATLFPDARIIFVTRSAWSNIASMIEGWQQPHLFPGYQTPATVTAPGQSRGRWAFTLIPGWRELVDHPVEEICAWQWVSCNEAVLDYLAGPGSLPGLLVRYEEFVASPAITLETIAAFLELPADRIPAYKKPLPEVNVVSPPGQEKWRQQAEAIARYEPIFAPTMSRLGYGDLSPRSTAR
jgi:hypothetical protein